MRKADFSLSCSGMKNQLVRSLASKGKVAMAFCSGVRSASPFGGVAIFAPARIFLLADEDGPDQARASDRSGRSDGASVEAPY